MKYKIRELDDLIARVDDDKVSMYLKKYRELLIKLYHINGKIQNSSTISFEHRRGMQEVVKLLDAEERVI